MSEKQNVTIIVPKGNERLLRLPEVIARTGLSKPTIYRMMSRGAFPANILIGQRAVAWKQSAIDYFIENGVAV